MKEFLRGNLLKIDYCEDKQKGRIYIGEYLKNGVSEEGRQGEQVQSRVKWRDFGVEIRVTQLKMIDRENY